MGINVATDWSTVLREQGRFADRMVRDVTKTLADGALSHDEAWQLFTTVQNCRRSFDELIVQLGPKAAEPAFRRAIGTLDGVWADLSTLAAQRVEDLRDSDAA